MIPVFQYAVLGTDLDANDFNLKNIGALDPVPSNLVLTTDPRLSDERVPLAGSVTNASVAAGAAIVQSKLNLNGQIPTAWLGTTATTAAQGNLAEYLSNKGQPNGYAALDGTGKIPAAQVPTAVGTGTVTSVGLSMPSQFAVTGSPVTGSGILAVAWNIASDQSWFGNMEGSPQQPRFYTDPLPVALIPDLDTSIVTTGLFDYNLLPVAVGLGGSHAPGAVPDPGDGSGGALATDYLARDMTFKAAPSIGPSYQPTLADPTINSTTNITGPITVTITHAVSDVAKFFSITSASAGFSEFPDVGYYSLAAGDTIWVYVSHPGYNNSSIVNFTNSNPP